MQRVAQQTMRSVRPVQHRFTSGRIPWRTVGLVTIGSVSTFYYLLANPPPAKLAIKTNPDPLDILDATQLSLSSEHLHDASPSELLRSYIVYRVSSIPILVDAAPSIISGLVSFRDSIPLLGPAVWWIASVGLRHTFFGKFCGGESADDCLPTMRKMLATDIGAIMSYSAEGADIQDDVAGEPLVKSAIEASFDVLDTAGKFQATSASAAMLPFKPTWVALKLTGFIKDASTLERASNAIISSSAYHRGDDDFSRPFRPSPALSDQDQDTLETLYEQLRRMCAIAKTNGTRILMDAEETWLQPAIDRYYDLLANEFNTVRSGDSPIIYNTFQCYLTSTPERLDAALARAKRFKHSAGIKLVRGAYVVKESKRAQELKYTNPIHATKTATDHCYDSASSLLLDYLEDDIRRQPSASSIGVVFASHNVASIKSILQRLRTDQFLKEDANQKLLMPPALCDRLHFGQLFGMSDQLTYALQSILQPEQKEELPVVIKVLPLGTIEECLPYLVRRAQENRSILKENGQLQGVVSEIRRRLYLA